MAKHDETTEHENENETPAAEVERPEQPAEPAPATSPEPAPETAPEPAAGQAPEPAAAQAPEASVPEPGESAPPDPAAEPARESAGEAAAAAQPDVPAAPPPATEPPAAAAGTQEQPQTKRKKKRLPRALRPARTRPRREPAAARKPIVRLDKPEHARGRSQERQGTVVSAGMDKTIVVKVDVIKSHRKYKKVVRRSTKLHAHDEANTAKVGDVVRLVETRPLSKTKRWRLAEVVEVAR